MLTQILSVIVSFFIGLIIAWPIGKWIVKRKEKKIIKKLDKDEVKVRSEIEIEKQIQKEVEDARKERREGAGERDRNTEGERRRLIRTREQGTEGGISNTENQEASGERRGLQVSSNSTDGTADINSTGTEQDTEDDWPDFS